MSQWRGYANDGAGISLGFSKDYLEQLSEQSSTYGTNKFSLNKIEYNIENQKKLLSPFYRILKQAILDSALLESTNNLLKKHGLGIPKDDKAKKLYDVQVRFYDELYNRANDFYLLKMSAFQEEHEWRLISGFIYDANQSCDFFPFDNGIKPYRCYELIKSNINPINEIIIGPKNSTSVYVIENFLRLNDFQDVKVIKSAASYR